MKIILAPDAFKGSMTAEQACAAMERAAKAVLPEALIDSIPLADGGEGTVQALVTATNGKTIECRVNGPLGDEVTAQYGILGNENTAVIEMASASGLPLVPADQRNPLKTTTFGTGQLIRHAVEKKVDKIIIGIGGSATTDCGTGMAQALGVRFIGHDDSEIDEFMTGERMGSVKDIDTHQCLETPNVVVACDVSNPLLGPDGAVFVYSSQKGATTDQLSLLEKKMAHIIDIIERKSGKEVRNIPGAGAAGGLGAGLMAFLQANLCPGIDIVLDACHFGERIRNADVIVTGEGAIDRQTLHGKTISGVLQHANPLNIPVIALAGSVADDIDDLYKTGLLSAFSICSRPMSLEEALDKGEALVQGTADRVFRLLNRVKK
ncbi:glycerate kinase [candidate division KSB1 bacterium]|nr:glycerate kinase [candidate division KSB1 bacterium]